VLLDCGFPSLSWSGMMWMVTQDGKKFLPRLRYGRYWISRMFSGVVSLGVGSMTKHFLNSVVLVVSAVLIIFMVLCVLTKVGLKRGVMSLCVVLWILFCWAR